MEFIKFDKENTVATITISKPKALNALSGQVIQELNDVLNQVSEDKSLRCLIITGDGEKAFVAGADIKELNTLDNKGAQDFAALGQDVFLKIETLRIPVIAAVNGFALGGGLELAMACDFIIASDNARFGLPECTLGLMPGFGGAVRLARKVGPSLAKQWTYTGDMIKTDEALRTGLVNKVVPQAELMAEVQKLAETMSSRAPLALTAIKQTIEKTYGMESSQAMMVEREAFGSLFDSADCREGTSAFLEKRKPEFKGQ
ncbi:MAG: enoyl-CoA hydratase/isomerase family protein [Bdellovibrionales bacterium]|nr:enoyl-CoA hydratase-related protein [Bdellovibrionales bacterium]NQZ19437.1 enoyl-CoA hydratase/isomerase family protein [Bdellovibrionales bacterium]